MFPIQPFDELYKPQRRAIRSDVLGFKLKHFNAINLKDKRTLSNCGITT